MKKFIFALAIVGVLPLTALAQNDDLYFTPKKSAKTAQSVSDTVEDEKPTYYCGRDCDVDEYNRRGKYWSHYQKIGSDAEGNDIIQFQKGRGVYPDSTYIDTTFVGSYYDTIVDGDDYRYTNRMCRWDGFYDPYYYSWRWRWGWGYPYWAGYYGWYDPWFYDYAWYDPWYYGWGYPYYYGWYGWGYPYYYAWGGPWYGGWGGYRYYDRPTGWTYSSKRGYGNYNQSGRVFGGRSTASAARTRSNSSRVFGGRSVNSNSSRTQRGMVFGGRSTQRSTRSYTPNYSNYGSRSVSSSPSFGGRSGGFSGGGFGGGARGGGGGMHGGRR